MQTSLQGFGLKFLGEIQHDAFASIWSSLQIMVCCNGNNINNNNLQCALHIIK
jgi:hypothetical protein